MTPPPASRRFVARRSGAGHYRIGKLYALLVVAFGAAAGLLTGLPLGWSAPGAGVLQSVVVGVLRSYGAGVTGSALLTAFVVWAHPLDPAELARELPQAMRRGLLLTLPAYLAAVVVASVALIGALTPLGVPWQFVQGALRAVGTADVAVGALAALLDAGLVTFLARRYLARLHAGQGSLPAQLAFAWAFGVGLRLSLGLVLSILFGG